MVPAADDPAPERRAEPRAARHGGRRWKDDPDLTAAVEEGLLQLSIDLNAAREGREWSQEELAHAAGIAPNTVLDIEQTRVDPHFSTIVRLAYAAGFDVDIRLRRPRRRRLPHLAAVNRSVAATS